MMTDEFKDRPNDIEPVRKKRLIYQANYRGFKEADLLLGGFAKANVDTMTTQEVTQFEELLTANDHDLWLGDRAPSCARQFRHADFKASMRL